MKKEHRVDFTEVTEPANTTLRVNIDKHDYTQEKHAYQKVPLLHSSKPIDHDLIKDSQTNKRSDAKTCHKTNSKSTKESRQKR